MWRELQRIVSRTEPELGLGAVLKVTTDGFIEVNFAKAGETRRYSAKNAPLQRFKLRAGQKACLGGGAIIEVLGCEEDEQSGLIQYSHEGGAFWEYEIEDRVQDSGALDLFLGGQFSRHMAYDLRRQARKIRSASERSGTQGLVGPRVTPLPHQLFIAKEVSRRVRPRVLLADEVGLGKTIEAGLIFSSLRTLQRGERVLIVTPESLIHQWVAEMFRRFNQVFSVINRERFDEDRSSQEMSSFAANQYVIMSIEVLLEHPEIKDELLAHPWELTIVDEAHHLRWDEEQPEEKWLMVKEIADHTHGLLLLTATPQQFGLATQFGLLHLVDPDRFGDFDSFIADQGLHQEVATLATYISAHGVDDHVRQTIKSFFSEDASLCQQVADPALTPTALLKSLIDRHGTGRVLFRNRRERLKGFPKRVLRSVPLEATAAVRSRLVSLGDVDDEMLVMDLATGRWNKRIAPLALEQNPKFGWLCEHLLGQRGQKTLILCGSAEGAVTLQKGLADADIQAAVFHENLSVVARDQEAAAFANPDGPDVLICSEIGGEGRNFQFSNQLIFIDLPKHPDLVEQRIGRLDRIGQRKDVEIYVPWIEDSPEETLFRWYHEGLDSFQSSWNGAVILIEEFLDEIFAALNAFIPGSPDFAQRHDLLTSLITASRDFASQVREDNKKSVDLLVDINSFDEDQGIAIQESVEDADDDTAVEFFMRSFLDYFGVDYEDFDDRGSIIIRPDNLKFIDKIPGIQSSEETLMTFDRDMALKREDMIFLSRDHPIVEECLGLLLDRNEGVASVCKWEDSPYGPGALIEFSIILEAQGPKHLELNRFLAVDAKELCYSHVGKRIKEKRHKKNDQLLSEVAEHEVRAQMAQMFNVLEPVVAKCLDKASRWAEDKVTQAISKAEKSLGDELRRLEELSAINPLVSASEISEFRQRLDETVSSLSRVQPRIDAVRLIFTR